jgi:cell division protein FtsL
VEKGRVKMLATFVLLLLSLFAVAWRQGRAFEAVTALDAVQRDRTLAELERDDLVRGIEALQSGTRVVREARTRLGMHVPQDTEIVLMSGDAR